MGSGVGGGSVVARIDGCGGGGGVVGVVADERWRAIVGETAPRARWRRRGDGLVIVGGGEGGGASGMAIRALHSSCTFAIGVARTVDGIAVGPVEVRGCSWRSNGAGRVEVGHHEVFDITSVGCCL